MQILAQLTDALSSGPMVPVGLGGLGTALVVVFIRFLARIETLVMNKLEDINHTNRALSKGVWMLLAEISTSGSFVREEAKRMQERYKAEDLADDEAKKSDRRTKR